MEKIRYVSLPEECTGAVKEALRCFGIEQADVRFLRRNENITCRVDTREGSYCLRIHSPVPGFSTGLLGETTFQSEVELLQYLREHGFAQLQRPIAGPDGACVYQLSDGAPAMLVTWVEGEPVTPETADPRAFGALATKLHRCGQGFHGDRPAYDPALVSRMVEEIQLAAEQGHLKCRAAEICTAELMAIQHCVGLRQKAKGVCLIHSDLNFGNILRTEQGLVPIDFSLARFGCFEQEIGMLMSNFDREEDWALLLEAVRENGMTIEKADAELFFSFGILLFICSQHQRFYQQDWFEKRMAHWCDHVFIHGGQSADLSKRCREP